MSGYTPTIGLEIHVELKTQTKMFCNSKNDPDVKEPNVNVCPICMGHPGTLPVINKEAVKHVLKVGVAVGGEIADFTEFDRKNYFYPDIPKGYQISQYAHPLVKGGELHGVALTRIHLEEDTARSQHEGDHSLVDFNRAGVPLMELVTEPVIHSAQEAGDFARELQLLLRTLGVSDADMEKGHLRVEVNISLREIADERESNANNHKSTSANNLRTSANLGTKVEVKNLNSFRAAEKSIEYEIQRQTELLSSGSQVVQETRGWDDVKGSTFSQRKKESSHDYRYFPEPDLPKLKISEIPEFSREALSKELPELPWVRRARYLAFGLKQQDADMFVNDSMYGDFFEAVSTCLNGDDKKIVLATNYIAADLAGILQGAPITLAPEYFAELIEMLSDGLVSSRGGKDILAHMVATGGSPKEIAEKEGLLQQSDEGALLKIVEQVIIENPSVVAEYKTGKEALLQFFVGQGMKLSKGSANPAMLQKLFKEKLS